MIKKLPDDVITKIAAGQVVEKPASVIKELVENSIDARAKKVNIETLGGGIKLMRVADDGIGMSKDDLELSPLPHTTSKIHNQEDLYNIHTLGFRGEALASIASMSRLVIKSRQKEEGYQIVVDNGVANPVRPVGIRRGTIVEVYDLFSNIPARKKDLSSEKRENQKIINSVIQIALANPNIGFKLEIDNKTILRTSPTSDFERINKLLGNFIAEGLVPIKGNDSGINISGYIGTPQIAVKQKGRQFLFVNGRPVKSEILSTHVKNLYGTLIDPRLHPSFIINIDLPADYIDINIHPRKEEVNFFTLEKVLEVLSIAIQPRLEQNNLTYQFSLQQSMSKKTAFHIKDATAKWSAKQDTQIIDNVIQIDHTFLVTQSRNSLLIIDQHAAHERILYEQFLEVFTSERKKDICTLEKEIYFSLPSIEVDILRENIEIFNNLGIKIYIKGSNIGIKSIPKIYMGHNLQQLISEVVSDTKSQISNLDTLSQRTISYLSCRGAIKAGDELSVEESKKLVEKLFMTKTNYTCPHGRPVLIEIPLNQLHIAFRRK